MVRFSVLVLLAAAGLSNGQVFPSFDSVGNSPIHPSRGAANSEFGRRFGQSFYEDGLQAPQTTGLPNARLVSSRLFATKAAPYNRHGISLFTAFVGQLVAHDVALTMGDAAAGVVNVSVAAGDDGLGDTRVMAIHRLKFASDSGSTRPRAPINGQTHFLDASSVYGASAERCAMLRTFRNGLLKADPINGVPVNGFGANLVPMGGPFGNAAEQRVAGDVRANVNPGLLALHGVFVLEHNRQAAKLKEANPTWDDERLFQEARKRVMAHMQAVVYNEYVPTLLGEGLPAYTGYNPTVDATASLEFVVAAYRYGHSGVAQVYTAVEDDGTYSLDGNILLRDAYFRPSYLEHSTIAHWLRGGVLQPESAIDTKMVDDLRNHLEGLQADLAAIDIVRAREVGLPTYSQTRSLYGLTPPTSFADITSNTQVAAALSDLYNGDVSKVELWVGGLAEAEGSSGFIGETFKAVIRDQFIRTRDGDRFWYENDQLGHYDSNGDFVPYLTAEERKGIKTTSFADIIRRTTGATVPNSVFRVPSSWPTSQSGSSGGGNNGNSGGGTSLNTATLSSFLSLEWEAPAAGDTEITITAKLKGTGWLAIGFGSGMSNADVIMMRVNGGNPEIIDALSTGYTLPAPDSSQDVVAVSGSESGGTTSITFRRKLNTGDANDRVIAPGAMPVIAAWDPTSDTFGQHTGTNRINGLQIDFFQSSGGNGTSSGGGFGLSDEELAKQVRAAKLGAYAYHALLMFAVWGILVPASVIVVRLFKHWPHWHSLHRWGGMLAASVTIPTAGAAIAASTSSNVLAHSYVGLTVAGTVLLQVATGTVTRQVMVTQAAPKQSYFVARTAHRVFGWFLTLAGMTNCMLGVAELLPELQFVVLGYFAVLLIGFVGLSVWDNVHAARYSLGSEEAVERRLATEAIANSTASLTITDVKNARRAGNRWIMLHGRVYDVTNYSQHHPGGAYLLDRHAGSDVTSLFLGKQAADSNVPKHAHSARAFELLQTMFIGVLRRNSSRGDALATESALPGKKARRLSDATKTLEWRVVEREIVTPNVSRPVVRLALEHASYNAGEVMEWDATTFGQYAMLFFPVDNGDTGSETTMSVASAAVRKKPTRRVTARRRRNSILDLIAGPSSQAFSEVSRPYTVVRRPGTNGFWLYVRKYPPPAEVSPLVHRLQLYDTVKASKPSGIGVTIDGSTRGTIVAIAQGTGITGYMDLIRFLVEQQRQREVQGLPAEFTNYLAQSSTAAPAAPASIAAPSRDGDMLFGEILTPPPSSTSTTRRATGLRTPQAAVPFSQRNLALRPRSEPRDADEKYLPRTSDKSSSQPDIHDAMEEDEQEASASVARGGDYDDDDDEDEEEEGGPGEALAKSASSSVSARPSRVWADMTDSRSRKPGKVADSSGFASGTLLAASSGAATPEVRTITSSQTRGRRADLARQNVEMGLRLVLLVCIATEEDLFEAEWLQECATECVNFELHLNITRPTGVSGGFTSIASTSTGYVTARRLASLLDDGNLTAVSICGTGKFCGTIKSQLLELGIPDSLIATV